MICRNCNKELPDDSFGTIYRKGFTYKRKNCKPCNATIDYQNKLKKLRYNGNSTVHNCITCGKYYKSKYDQEQCIDCRNSDKRINQFHIDVFNPRILKAEYKNKPEFIKHLYDEYIKSVSDRISKSNKYRSELMEAVEKSTNNYKRFMNEK